MKICIICNLSKLYEDFPKSSSSKDGKHSYCKQCMVNQRMSKYEYKKKKLIKTEKTKQCRCCENIYDIEEFSKRKNSGYRQSYCKKCIQYIGHQYNIKRFGITVDQYADMLKKQNMVCLICKDTDNKRLSIDHDHSCCPGSYSCGKCIRGLLCSRCNKTLGLVKDNVDYLNSMIQYLQIF